MAYNSIKQIVIDSTTKAVKRHGYCDFANDGSFDAVTELIIEKDFIFTQSIHDVTWQYDPGGVTFNKI